MRKRAAVLGLAACAFAAACATAPDQGADVQLALQSGFQPDPFSVPVLAGGTRQASALSATCVGWIAEGAAVSLRYQGDGELPLIFSAESEADATLLVRTPDGSWHCDDDSGGALKPMLRFDAPQNGEYRIWVGTYGEAPAQAMLHVSEIALLGDGQPDFSTPAAAWEYSPPHDEEGEEAPPDEDPDEAPPQYSPEQD